VKGLKSELLLIPHEKLNAVLAVLADESTTSAELSQSAKGKVSHSAMIHGKDCWEIANEHRRKR